MTITDLEAVRKEYRALQLVSRVVQDLATEAQVHRSFEPSWVIIEDEFLESCDSAVLAIAAIPCRRFITDIERDDIVRLNTLVEQSYSRQLPMEDWSEVREAASELLKKHNWDNLMSQEDYEMIYYWAEQRPG